MHGTWFKVFLCLAVSCDSLRLAKDVLSDPNDLSKCTKVYLDIGSNLGVQVRKLFEPTKYPNAKIRKVFKKSFGEEKLRSKPSSETGICAIGFEANPHWQKRLKDLEKTYQKQGWNTQFFVPRAVSNVDNENVTFYVDNVPDHSDWGASLGSKQAEASNAKHGKGAKMLPMTVQTLDMSKFIQSTVLSNARQNVLAKMDIEGAEFIVLPGMIKAGLLCKGKVDSIFIEWHPRWQGLDKQEEYKRLKKDLLQQIHSAKNCQGAGAAKVLEIDDETYRDDGKEMPKFSKIFAEEEPEETQKEVAQILETTKAIYAESAKIARQD